MSLAARLASFFSTSEDDKKKEEKTSPVVYYACLLGLTVVVVGGVYLWYQYRDSRNLQSSNDGAPNQPESDEENDVESPTFTECPPTNRSSKYKTQESIRQMCEQIFHVPFYETRDVGLVNRATGRPMEIDIYNPSLKLGVEYNGEQHYKVNSMTPNEEALEKRKTMDAEKVEQCRLLGIHLVVIPYYDRNNAFNIIMESLPPRLSIYRRQRL